MANRSDVAKLANVSVATVSNVINNSKNVSEELKKRVNLAISQLHYIPNQSAKSLASKKTNQIMVVVNNICNPYYSELARLMQKIGQEYGYSISVMETSDLSIKTTLGRFANNSDAMFVVNYIDGLDDEIKVMKYAGSKIISSSKVCDWVVRCSYDEAICDMVACLKDNGHKNIAFITAMSKDSPCNIKLTEFRRALELHELPMNENLISDNILVNKSDHKAGYIGMKNLLESGEDFTAVYVVNDLMAVGAYRAVKEAGLKVPQDISIVGCDNIELSQYVYPTLSTMGVDLEVLANGAMKIIFAAINDEKKDVFELKAEFIKRNSIRMRE